MVIAHFSEAFPHSPRTPLRPQCSLPFLLGNPSSSGIGLDLLIITVCTITFTIRAIAVVICAITVVKWRIEEIDLVTIGSSITLTTNDSFNAVRTLHILNGTVIEVNNGLYVWMWRVGVLYLIVHE